MSTPDRCCACGRPVRSDAPDRADRIAWLEDGLAYCDRCAWTIEHLAPADVDDEADPGATPA